MISYYLSSWLNFEGLRYVSAQLERLILYIYPTIVAVLAWLFLKEKITARHVIALLLAYAGVAILFGTEIGHQGPNAWLGGGLIFAGAFIYAIYVTASKPVITKMGATLFTAFGMSVASIAFLTQSGIEMALHAPPPVTANGYWLALTLAILCTVIPSFMISSAIGIIGPGPTSAVGGVGPVVAAWAAVMILHEPFGLAASCGDGADDRGRVAAGETTHHAERGYADVVITPLFSAARSHVLPTRRTRCWCDLRGMGRSPGRPVAGPAH